MLPGFQMHTWHVIWGSNSGKFETINQINQSIMHVNAPQDLDLAMRLQSRVTCPAGKLVVMLQVGSHLLPRSVFDVPIRRDILHRVVRWQRAKAQQVFWLYFPGLSWPFQHLCRRE